MAVRLPMRCPVYIFGYPRSGTTLMRAVLGLHPEIALRNETELIFAMLLTECPEVLPAEPEARMDLVRQLERIRICRLHLERLPEGTIDRLLETPRLTFQDLYEGLLPSEPKGQIWGEKSNNYVFFVEKLSELYPDALYVHMVRDPRSIALSQWRKKCAKRALQAPEEPGARTPGAKGKQPAEPDEATRFNISVTRDSLRWPNWVAAAGRGRDRVGADGWVDVRFEAFVRRPEPILADICERLGVPVDPQMLSAEARGRDPVLSTEHAYAHQNLRHEFDPSRAAASEELPDLQAWLVERFAGEAMATEGYALRARAVDAGARGELKGFLHDWQEKLQQEVEKLLQKRFLTMVAKR